MRDIHRHLLLLVLLLVAPIATCGELADGPYVSQDPKGEWRATWVNGDETAPIVRRERVSTNWWSFTRNTVTVPAVGSLPAFKVRLRKPDSTLAGIAPDEVSLPPDTRLFVVADTHGEFEILVGLLQKHGVIDAKLRWGYQRGHLAILGDMFDRGPHHTEILWLLYKLEAEAKRARGAVHVILGNHETLVLLGAREYLNPKYLATAKALDAPTYASLWDEQTLLGQWLRTRPGVQKIGDYLCLHGGISAEAVRRQYSVAHINQTVRDVLNYTRAYAGPKPRYTLGDLLLLGRKVPAASEAEREQAGFILQSKLGPLWYRGYFPEVAQEMGFPIATDEDVEQALASYQAKTILVGHTIVPTVTPLYGGKVIGVQVYPRRDEKTGQPIMEALLIDKGTPLRAKIDGTTAPLAQLQPEGTPFRRGHFGATSISIRKPAYSKTSFPASHPLTALLPMSHRPCQDNKPGSRRRSRTRSPRCSRMPDE